jgi:hypothetical protein
MIHSTLANHDRGGIHPTTVAFGNLTCVTDTEINEADRKSTYSIIYGPRPDLIVSPKSLAQGRSSSSCYEAKVFAYQTRRLSPITNPMDRGRPDLYSSALPELVSLCFPQVLLD